MKIHKTHGPRLDRIEIYIPKLLQGSRKYRYFKSEPSLCNKQFAKFATERIREITKDFTYEQLKNWLHDEDSDDGSSPHLYEIVQEYKVDFPDDEPLAELAHAKE